MHDVLRFSPLKDNAKLSWMGKGAYGFSTLAGINCPGAHLCKSQVVETPEGRRIKDGPHTEFRCWAASQELVYKATYEQRKHNMETLMGVANSQKLIVQLIQNSLPEDTKIVRVNVSGDMQNQRIFDSWLEVATLNPQIVLYAYTKSLKFWVKRLDSIPENFRLTASFGGRDDNLISEFGLKFCKVVYSTYEAKKLKLPLDHDDRHAMLEKFKNTNFSIHLHGTQPKGSSAALNWKAQIDGRRKFHGYNSGKSFSKYQKENYDVTTS